MSDLRLRRFPSPSGGIGEVGFPSWIAACEHLCDHVLTPPESHGWALLLPEARRWLSNDRLRMRFGREIWRTEGLAAQALLDAWLALIERAIGDAAHLGWSFLEAGDEVCFGPSGILAAVGRTGRLRSAYLPLRAVPLVPSPEGHDLVEKRRRDPFPREGRWRLDGTAPVWTEAASDAENTLERFRLFRRTSEMVRSRLIHSYSKEGSGEPPPLDLFRRARRDQEVWLTLVPPLPEEAL